MLISGTYAPQGMPKSHRSPNDQRSDAFNQTSAENKARMDHNSNIHNPTSPEFQAIEDNRANQLNPNNTATKSKK